MADPSWEETEKNLRWSLITGDADREGRGMMLEALSKANVDFMGQYKDGFYKTQDHNDGAKYLFDACARQDQRRLYNLGRQLNGQPPV